MVSVHVLESASACYNVLQLNEKVNDGAVLVGSRFQAGLEGG